MKMFLMILIPTLLCELIIIILLNSIFEIFHNATWFIVLSYPIITVVSVVLGLGILWCLGWCLEKLQK
jgi:hypothetical protein